MKGYLLKMVEFTLQSAIALPYLKRME